MGDTDSGDGTTNNFLSLFLQSYGLVPPQVNPCDPKRLCGPDADPSSESCTEMVSDCRGGKVEAACNPKEVCGPNADPDSAECKAKMDACLANLVGSNPRGIFKQDVQELWFLKQNAAVLNETLTDRVNHKVNLVKAIISRIPKWLTILAICLAGVAFVIFLVPVILIMARMLADSVARFKLIMLVMFAVLTMVAYFLMIQLKVL